MISITIREETARDQDAVCEVHLLAFSEGSPGHLAHELRQSGDAVISLVAEHADKIVGHVLFSKIEAPMPALTLAPVGIHPEVQKVGVGSALIRKGLEQAQQVGWKAVFVLGAPARYGRFGFNAISAQGYNSPYKGPDFMALLFCGGAPKTGQLIFPTAFKEDIKERAARQQA